MPEVYNEITLTTLKEIYPKVLQDQWFLNAAFLAYIRDRCTVPFTGGEFTQNVHIVKPLLGGSYRPGQNWAIQKRQTLAATSFDMRYYNVPIVLYSEDMDVINKGPLAVFSLVDTETTNAVMTMSEIMALELTRHGQAASGSTIVDDRSSSINAMAEAMNDGVTPGWDGNRFPTYGGATRNSGLVSNKLNSIPFFCGDATGAPGSLTFDIMQSTYQDACRGKKEPKLGLVNKAARNFMTSRLEAKQRFAQEKDPVWGVTALRFNNAMILVDEYQPSLAYGRTFEEGRTNLTSTFVCPSGISSLSGLTQGATIQVAEVLQWIHPEDWLFRVSNSEEYAFGLTPFMKHTDNSRVVAHLKAAVNLECLCPQDQKQVYGFNS